MQTKGEAISRIRNNIKAVREDAFITDRYIYSFIDKFGKLLLKREDNALKVMSKDYLFTFIPYIQMEEVDKIDSDCVSIKSRCTIMKSVEKLPEMAEGSWGPLIRSISSIDMSTDAKSTHPSVFNKISKSTTFKYNKDVYYFFRDGYIYLLNAKWEAIAVEAIFDDDISADLCHCEEDCKNMQDTKLPFPDYMMAEVDNMVLQAITAGANIPVNDHDDKQHILR
jgi:hypothetical protein